MAFGTKKSEPRSVNEVARPIAPVAPRTAPAGFGSSVPPAPGGFGQTPKPGSGTVVAIPAAANPQRSPAQIKSSVSALPANTTVMSANYFEWKKRVSDQLFGNLDLMQRLGALDSSQAAEEIQETARQIMAELEIAISKVEQDQMLRDLVDDILGFGPLQPLLDRQDIADIMVNRPDQVYIEVGGQMELVPNCRFIDESHVFNIAQRLVGQSGRSVDEANPICEARLSDGSRLSVVVPPITKYTTITIRKFRAERLTLNDLIKFGTISPNAAELLKIIGKCRLNVIVSGGTGSGKTTLLNCLSAFIDDKERILTVEDTAELQLQQPHVVPMEARPPSIEGVGEINIEKLVKTTLRMRPTRVLIGEVRGEEMFFLLQAMSSGHPGSMGTLHANDPKGALTRMESFVVMGRPNLNKSDVRKMIHESVDVIVQVNRLPDGTRRITHITELTGMEGDVISTQDLLVYKIEGEDERRRIIGHHEFQGVVKPKIYEKAAFYGEGERLMKILSGAA
ncbi:CpaF family protein [Microvirga sesbaniae]|uniref:CpaF family protein n=1 Tax=Microvirga sesbaniae TaxID=681392 RepID=UPI0021C67C9B|nr:CpaF family protein [Microvirga sp. HBU67692]